MSSVVAGGLADAKRWVTVLCIELPTGDPSMSPAGAAVPDDDSAALGQAFAAVVERHGGQLQPAREGTLQAVFGLPQFNEPDALRAVEAALSLLHDGEERAPDPALPTLCCGIHGGMVPVCVDPASSQAQLETASLAEVALALSRLNGQGSILVTEESLGPFTYAFSSHALGTIALPGLGIAPRVRRILGRQGSGSRIRAAQTRGMASFVGRSAELQILRDALAGSRHEAASLWLVTAPAGAGKTRMIETFLREASGQGCQVLQGDCEAGLNARPLRPFCDMLRRHWQLSPGFPLAALQSALERQVGSVDPAAVSQVPALLTLLGLAGSKAERIAGAEPYGDSHRALLALLQGWARQAPLVLFVDDWHWADDASREVVHLLLATPGLRAMVLAAARPDLGGDVCSTIDHTLALAPLTEAEALQSIRELLPGGEPFLLQDVARWSGGNPLFIEELCHHVLRYGGLPQSPPSGAATWVENLIASRLSALPPELLPLLNAAAVIGMTQPLAALMHLTGCNEHDPRLQALAHHDILHPTGQRDEFRFKHELTRRVADAAMDPSIKRELHHRMAVSLNPEDDPRVEAELCEALAYHWAGADDCVRAARCSELAGDRAMASSAVDLAKVQYRSALDMLERQPDTPDRYRAWRSVLRRYGLVSVFDPAATEVRVFERALQMALSHADQKGAAYAEYWTGYAWYALGRHRQALRHGQACLARARDSGESTLTLQAEALLSQVHAAMGHAAQAQVLFDRTLPAVIELWTSGAPVGPGLSYLLACQAQALGDQGRFEEAERLFDQALGAVPGRAHEVNGSILCLRASVRLWAGQPAQALVDAQAAQDIGARVRSLYLHAMARALAGRAQWCLDGAPSAVKAIAEASAWMQSHGQRLYLSLIHGWLAEAAAISGEAGSVRQHVRLALACARDGDGLGLPMALRAWARVEVRAGRPHRAHGHLALAERIARRRLSSHEQQANQALQRSLSSRREPSH